MEMQLNKNDNSANDGFCHLGPCGVIVVRFTEDNVVLMKIMTWNFNREDISR